MNFTVKDLAEYAGIQVKEMIAKLTDLAPDLNWKANTPVPDNLVQMFMGNVDEYKSNVPKQPAGTLTSSEGTGASIAQLRINAEATQYALVQSLAHVDMRDIITTAVSHSLGEIETYEATKAQVWNKYVESRISANQSRSGKVAERLHEQAASRQKGISDRMATQTQTTAAAKASLEEAQDFLAQTLANI